MKTRKYLITGFAVVIMAAAVFASANEGAKSESAASARELYRTLPTPTPYPTSLPGFTSQVMEKYARSEVITQTVNGVEMSAANFRLENNALKVEVCFQTPNNNDWFSNASIQIGNEEIPADEMTIFEIAETLGNGQKQIITNQGDPPQLDWRTVPSNGQPDYRCDTLGFRLSSMPLPSDVTLIIKSIVSTPREGDGCAEHREVVQSLLDAKAARIRIDCAQNDFEFGARTRYVIVEKPSSISQDEAMQLISNILRELFTINGPWVFAGTIEQ